MKNVTDIKQFKKEKSQKTVNSFGKPNVKPERVTPSGVKVSIKEQPEPPRAA